MKVILRCGFRSAQANGAKFEGGLEDVCWTVMNFSVFVFGKLLGVCVLFGAKPTVNLRGFERVLGGKKEEEKKRRYF